ncbi:transglycosylase domain-containing protein, partial [Candidatus Uhrbacteria bacterium]|nr:transglycosylase domain-containing protein [Candidatus Uhrbacteria bacterium]
ITQQVVKNALLTQNKTIGRKLEEIILALRLERVYTKEQILHTYLNETSYGGTIYGVEEASQYYFGVDAKDIDLAQSAYLAALPQAPTRLSPYGNNKDQLDARKNLVLRKMREIDSISEEEYQDALSEEVKFRDEREAGIKAPHFVFYIREYLEERYGAETVANGGLKAISTLDYDLQKKTEEIIAEDSPKMEQNFNASNAGAVAIEPKSGQILAMVGSRGYFDETIDGKVNITTAYRQPGSSFKPFVYATAFKKGYTPETVVFDVKTQFSTLCPPNNFSDEPPCYSPENFDNTFKGPITLRGALAQSVNVPSVKTLYLAGIKESIETAHSMGITTLEDPNRYGLTLVLGGGEVTLLELTSAYGVFGNDGIRSPIAGILRVEDRKGNVLESYEEKSERVLDSQIARTITDILSDEAARAPEFGAYSPLYFEEAVVADKTGTTNDFRDVWVVGYTPGVVVGAWAGNNDNTPMEKRIAAFIIAPMWHKVLSYAIQKYPADEFPPPAPENSELLPPVLRGEWNSNPAEGVHDILYWVNKNNPRGGGRGSQSDPQFSLWEYPVSLWAGGMGSTTPGVPAQAGAGIFRITSPLQGATLSALTPIILSAEHPNPGAVSRVAYYLGGVYVGASVQAPYSIALVPQARGLSQLKAVAESSNGGKEETTVTFTIN